MKKNLIYEAIEQSLLEKDLWDAESGNRYFSMSPLYKQILSEPVSIKPHAKIIKKIELLGGRPLDDLTFLMPKKEAIIVARKLKQYTGTLFIKKYLEYCEKELASEFGVDGFGANLFGVTDDGIIFWINCNMGGDDVYVDVYMRKTRDTPANIIEVGKKIKIDVLHNV